MKTSADFSFSPSHHVPFRDMEAIKRVRAIPPEKLTEHPNPDFRITIYPDDEILIRLLTDMFHRIKTSDDEDRRVVMIIPQPWPHYKLLAHMINTFRVNCRNLYTFNMDEYANEDGEIAPEGWPFGFTHALKKYFYSEIDPELRPPEGQMTGLTPDTFADYGQRLTDLGGADICYSGPGWTGHLAFIEPDAPEFAGDLEDWKKMGPRIATLSPFTLAQNSLHGSLGKSGDLTAVPPKAATIGPTQVIEAKHRIDLHAISVRGTDSSWQRLISRLVLHGPVTPLVPESILQTLRTDVWMSETIAQPIEPDWTAGY